MTRRSVRPLAIALSAAVLGAVVPATANAGLIAPDPQQSGTTTQGVVVDIHDCQVKRSRNNGGFTWASCSITWTGPQVQNGSVRWSSNLATFKPANNNGSWRSQTGTEGISGGDGMWGVKLAFRNRNLTVAQVRSRLRVTLSNPQNVTIGDATATAAAS
jgi:hypothetical protein